MVAIGEVEFERVGLVGRITDAGDGIVGGGPTYAGMTFMNEGDVETVGVGTGVELAEETAVEIDIE